MNYKINEQTKPAKAYGLVCFSKWTPAKPAKLSCGQSGDYIWPNGPPGTARARQARHDSRAVLNSAVVPTQRPRHGTIMA